MADVNIGAKINVDTGGGAQSIAEMQAEIKKLSSEVKNAKVGSEEYVIAQDKLKEAQQKLSTSTKENVSSFEKLKDGLKGTVPGFGAAAEGAEGLGKTFLKLLANPIVLVIAAIVVGLKFLYDAFTYTKEGGKTMGQVMEGISAVFKVVIDRVMTIGGAIIKFFSGDWKGAMEDGKKAVSGFADEVVDSFNRAAAAKKELQAITKAMREIGVERAKQNADIAEQKEAMYDEDKSVTERRAALNVVKEKELALDQKELELLERKLKNAKATADVMAKSGKDKKAALEEEAALEIEYENKRGENATKRRQLDKVGRNLDKQEAAKEKEEEKAASEEQKARIQNLREYENKLLKLKQDEQLAMIKDSYEKERRVIENKVEDEKRANALSLAQGKLTREQMNTLNANAYKLGQLQLDELKSKHEKEEKAKRQDYEKELSKIESDTKLQGITDARQKELVTLAETYSQKRLAVITNEKRSAAEKTQLIAALEKQEHDQKEILDKKFFDEDRAKAITDAKLLIKADYDLKLAQKKLTYQMELNFFNQTRELDRQELVNKKATMAELAAFDQETRVAKINLSNKQRDVEVQNYNTVGSALQGLSALAGQQTAVGKGLAIAQAIINTYTGATKALAQGGIFGAVGAAGVIASGLASVKSIISVQVPGGGGAGQSAPSMSSPLTPATKQNTTTVLDSQSIQQMGNATAVKAFVVESDVRNNQERISRINRAARIH